MRRRDFLGLVGGAMVAGMNSARAQRGSRRVEVLMGAAETSSSRDWVAAFLRRLDELGWREGHNLIVQVQWWNDRPEQMRARAAELISRSPDVAVTFTNLALEVLKPIAGNLPIVFCGVSDPVGSGFVASLAGPGGNITGFAWVIGRAIFVWWHDVPRGTMDEVRSYCTAKRHVRFTMPYADAKAWQARLRGMDEDHRCADRLLLLETSSDSDYRRERASEDRIRQSRSRWERGGFSGGT